MSRKSMSREMINQLPRLTPQLHAEIVEAVRSGDTIELVCVDSFRAFSAGSVYKVERVDSDTIIIIPEDDGDRFCLSRHNTDRQKFLALVTDLSSSVSADAKVRAKESYKSVPLDMLVQRYEELTGEAQGIKEVFQKRTRSIT